MNLSMFKALPNKYPLTFNIIYAYIAYPDTGYYYAKNNRTYCN